MTDREQVERLIDALALERAADAAGRIGWHCVSCGHVCKDPEKDLETLRKAGARSCCPEREMEPLSETLNAALTPSPNALAEHDAKVRAEEREAYGPVGVLLLRAVKEAERAMQKFPQPNYVISKWAEETGEVTKAAIHYAENRETVENLCGEIVQSLAMLHRLIVEGDEVHGAQPFTAAIREQDND